MRLHGVFGSPLPCGTVVSCPVRLQELGNVRNQWIIWVGVSEEGADWQEDFGNGQRRTPLILQDIQADTSVRVDVAVINTSGEVNLGWLEWVIGREVNIQEENTSSVWRVIWSHDSGLPVEHIIPNWSCRAVGWRILAQVDKFYSRKGKKTAGLRNFKPASSAAATVTQELIYLYWFSWETLLWMCCVFVVMDEIWSSKKSILCELDISMKKNQDVDIGTETREDNATMPVTEIAKASNLSLLPSITSTIETVSSHSQCIGAIVLTCFRLLATAANSPSSG